MPATSRVGRRLGPSSRALIVALQMRFARVREMGSGAVATEYAILVGFLVAAIVVGATLLGASISGWFSALADRIP